MLFRFESNYQIVTGVDIAAAVIIKLVESIFEIVFLGYEPKMFPIFFLTTPQIQQGEIRISYHTVFKLKRFFIVIWNLQIIDDIGNNCL